MPGASFAELFYSTFMPAGAHLTPQFFARPVLAVARDLLGMRLVGPAGAGIITEVEAYDGPEDAACHGRFGPTPRTAPMFGPPGHWYVYLVYGMHWMLNAVTDREGYPAAVLIRGVGEWSGPGKVTKSLGVDGSYSGSPIAAGSRLWIEESGMAVPDSAVLRTPRIGIDYAGGWKDAPYRFLLSGEAALQAGRVLPG